MMIKGIKFVLFVALIMTMAGISRKAGAQNPDFGIWTAAGIEKHIRKFNLGIEAELRTQSNVTEIDRYSFGLSAEYRLLKPLNIGLTYQFIGFHDMDYADYQPRHRFALDLTGKMRFGKCTLSLRERLQLTTKDEGDRIRSNGEINVYRINPDITLRSRVKVSYNLPHFPVTPALSFEAFYQLNDPDGNSFEDLRAMATLCYKLNRHNFLEVYGLFTREINVSEPVAKTVMGLSYVYEF